MHGFAKGLVRLNRHNLLIAFRLVFLPAHEVVFEQDCLVVFCSGRVSLSCSGANRREYPGLWGSHIAEIGKEKSTHMGSVDDDSLTLKAGGLGVR